MTRVTDLRPLRVTSFTVSLAEVRALHRNPAVREVRGVRRLGEDRYAVQVVYVGLPARRQRRTRIRFEGLRRYLTVMALVLGVPAALLGAGWLVWVLFGAALTAAVKLVATAAAAVLLVAAAVWLLSAKAGVCAGLHCPGCPHK